jgi:hypothetical protein
MMVQQHSHQQHDYLWKLLAAGAATDLVVAFHPFH